MNIVNVKLEDLHPYENNPRKNEKAINYVANSIREFGFKVPIVIDKDNVIVCGHTRYMASKSLRLKEVPCVIADDLSEEQIKAYRLADNKVAEFSKWDGDLLGDELKALEESFNMCDFGFPIRIDDIDVVAEGRIEISAELGELNDYIVLEFKNEVDWQRAIVEFGLKKVSTPDKNPRIRRHGIGRVIDGAEVLERLSHEH